MTLTQARQLLGWNQTRLAKEAGEKISAIFDLESGRNLRPAYVLVMHIFHALQRGGLRGVAVEDIFPVPEPGPSTGEAPTTEARKSEKPARRVKAPRAGRREKAMVAA